MGFFFVARSCFIYVCDCITAAFLSHALGQVAVFSGFLGLAGCPVGQLLE
jgi:hypothetical protein